MFIMGHCGISLPMEEAIGVVNEWIDQIVDHADDREEL